MAIKVKTPKEAMWKYVSHALSKNLHMGSPPMIILTMLAAVHIARVIKRIFISKLL